MLLDEREVVDHLRQLGRCARLLANEARDRSAAELMGGGELCPKGDQRVRFRWHLNGKAAGSLPVATTTAADPDITLPIVAMQGFYQPSRETTDP
jgi:hypothetical protein